MNKYYNSHVELHLNKRHIFCERVNGSMELRRGFDISEGDKVLIVEDIITEFSLIKSIEIISHTAAFSFKNKEHIISENIRRARSLHLLGEGKREEKR